jgi:hypothetical protein
MNAFTSSEALMATDQLAESGGNPSNANLLPKACLHEQTQLPKPVGAYDPAEDASETFIGGDGI